jgi:hypothetical protein
MTIVKNISLPLNFVALFLVYFRKPVATAQQKTGKFFSFTFLPIFIANYIYNSLLKAYCNLGVSSGELTPEFKTQGVG